MSTKPQIELFLENESGTQQVAYPFVESDHVSLSNGMDIDTMIRQDVSMPTVVHEDLSFKAGVGDQDVSSAIVDSSVAEMTIKGQTYQNILPEPSTHVLTNNKEMFKVNEGLDANVEIVDGVSKSAILKGQTLVNIIDKISFTTSNGYFHIYLKQYEVNKNYLLVIFNAPNGIAQIYVGNSNATMRWRDYTTDFIRNGSTISLKVTCPSNFAGSVTVPHFKYESSAPSLDEFKQMKAMLIPYQDGMENWDIPYFNGMQSVKMPVLCTTGKNLFDSSTEIVTGQGINSTNGLPYNISSNSRTGFLRVKSNTTYTITQSHNRTWVFAYNKNKEYIKVVKTDILSGGNFTTPNDTYYIRLDFNTANTSEIVNGVQIEEGSVATSYEPYKTNILSCQLAPLNQSMFEQGTFAESTPPNTQPYEGIKLGSEHLYTTRIRTKGTYKVVKGATYSGQLNNGYGIFICYCKNGLYSAKDKGWIDETNFTFTVPNDCDEMFFALRKTDDSAITPSDYPLIGLKIHQEVVLRSLPNGVKDTLNLMTGEYVQRIGETTLDGSSRNDLNYHGVMKEQNGQFFRMIVNQCSFYNKSKYGNCDKLTFYHTEKIDVPVEGVFPYSGDKHFYIQISTSRISGADSMEQSSSELKTAFQDWLQANPITIQYELETPIIKTVDLSTSGNWEKVILDGSEDIAKHLSGNFMYYTYGNSSITNVLPYASGGRAFANHTLTGSTGVNNLVTNYKYIVAPKTTGTTGLCFSLDGSMTAEEAKAFLSQNPITVWYQTQTQQDSTQVKQPIFFKDGHIQLSSGADNSLIPTLDYQAKTSNSYVMDLMKTNTRYTMKAKSASGTFTIDGTSYGAGTNGTFTTPTSMTNKLLVMSNKTNEEVMILEGDVTDKTIPYFKGIKSAFENEDKIEVLSTGKNLFDISRMNEKAHALHTGVKNIIDLANNTITTTNNNNHTSGYGYIITNLKPNTPYLVTVTNDIVSTGVANFNIGKRDGTSWHEQRIERIPIGATKSRIVYADNGKLNLSVNVMTNGTNGQYSVTLKNIQIEEAISANAKSTTYEPYKSNSTKIPLLSPLRSLPNGVCDELIIDRMKNKATLIQRIDYIQLSGEHWTTRHSYSNMSETLSLFATHPINNFKNANYGMLSQQFQTYQKSAEDLRYETQPYIWNGKTGGALVYVWMELSKLVTDTTSGVQRYFNSNPLDLYYELATPVVTEIDLENFPYIYKDGHIFLNGEITPVTEIKYSINQQHQIESSSQDLIRHQKEIDYLYKLIGEYVRVDYKNTLLSLNLELK